MRSIQTLLFVVVCATHVLFAGDSGPSDFFSLKSASGYGPFIRGAKNSLSIVVGNRSSAQCSVQVSVESDSGSFSERLSLTGDESKTVAIDLKRIQFSESALLTVRFVTPAYYGESSTATRELRFVWEHIGVRLDSLSSVPWVVGTGKPLTLQFSPAIAMPRVDSCSITLVSADGLQRKVVYVGSSIPTSYTIPEADVAALALGSKVVTYVQYADKARTNYHIDIELPIEPTPIAFTAYPTISPFATNAYGGYRTPITPSVPTASTTLQLKGLPAQCERIVLQMVLEDSATEAIDTITAPGTTNLPTDLALPVVSTNLDVRTTAIRASMYVRSIPKPFDVDLPVRLATQRAHATVTSASGGAGRLTMREWNPHNTATPTITPDTTQVVTLAWPIGRIDSLEMRYLSSQGLTLRRAKLLPNKDRHTSVHLLEPRYLPPSTSRVVVRAFIDGIPNNTAVWDTSIVLTPSLPSLKFQRQSEYTSIGAVDVSDVLTIGDLPEGVDSVQLTLRDADSALNYVDTTLNLEAAPYRGDVLFAASSKLSVPLSTSNRPIRSLGFFVRSASPLAFTLLTFKGGFPDIELQSDPRGQLRMVSGSDTLESSYVIKTHDWHYVCIVRKEATLYLYVNGGYQGQMNVAGLFAPFTPSDQCIFGHGGTGGDSLFAITSMSMWENELDVRDVQTIQVSPGSLSNVVRYLPLSTADTNASKQIVVQDQISGDEYSIDDARLENTGSRSSFRAPLLDIGMWRYWSASRAKQAIAVDAYLTYFIGSTQKRDTVLGLIQLQSIAGALDSARCPDTGLPKSTLASTQGWGPFNTLAPYGSSIIYRAGYTWKQAGENAAANKDGFAVTFSLINGEGLTTDSVTVNFSRNDVRDSAVSAGDVEIIVSTPRPMRMDLITDSTFVVLVENSATINGWNTQCLDIQAQVEYSEPPPIPVLASSIGPFRQSKIPNGQQILNTFTAFTVNVVEDSLDFVVQNHAGAVIRKVPGKQVAPGVWKADIDMASCMPPIAEVHAQSYEKGFKKRTSQPLQFTIRANRPIWMTRGSDIRWSNLVRNGTEVRASAHVNIGPIFRHSLTKRIPLLSDIELMLLPIAFTARLAWNSSTNELQVIKDSSRVRVWYTTDSKYIDTVNAFVGDLSNVLSVLGALVQASKLFSDAPSGEELEDPVIDGCEPDPPVFEMTEPSDPDIPNLNWDLTNTESSSFILDSAGNLNVRSTFLEGGILQLFPGGPGIQATVNFVIGEAEDEVEEFTAGVVNLNVLPVIQGAFEFLIRSYLGADRSGNWGPRGTLPTQLEKADTTSMVGSGISAGLGLALQLNVLQGVATVTCALTGNLVDAQALGYTQREDGMYESVDLASLGFSVDVVIFSQELWGAAEQYLYGPTSVWKARLAGDDLEELYPLAGSKKGSTQERALSNEESSTGRYQTAVYLPPAAPSPRSARYGDHSAIVWVDQDHLTGIGTLQLGIHRSGEERMVSIQRIVENGMSIVSPEVCALTDSTIIVTWKEVDVDRTTFTSSTSRLFAHSTSDIQWAVVNAESGTLLSTGEIATDSAQSSSIRDLMVDGKPHVARVSDTSAMVVWIAADTIGVESAIYSAMVHGNNGVFKSDEILVVQRDAGNHLMPRVVGRNDGTAYCSWIASDSTTSDLHTSTFNGASWSVPTVISIPDVLVDQIDTEESGAALLLSGKSTKNRREREILSILRTNASGEWDLSTRRDLHVGQNVSMIHHPRISVRGDSACIVFRSAGNTSGKIGHAIHRMTSVVVDLRNGAYGYGEWTPTDSLSLINDYDIQWEPDGVHVVAQEHLPFSGLHTNGSLQRPFGLPQMNLGMHTFVVRDVITGIRSDDRPTASSLPSYITLAPTPAWSTVSIRTERPFKRVTLMSLGGSVISTPFEGAPTQHAAIDVTALPPGTYILTVDTPEGLPAVTLLRIGSR